MALFDFGNPDRGTSKTANTAVNSVQFGDGYAQETPEGINNITETWNPTWTLMSIAKLQAMDTFLEEHAGAASFTWLTPQGRTLTFKCKSWNPTYDFDGNCSLSAEFKQYHELS